MVLSPRLQITQSQKLMMNPQMQQAIQLLQLTNVELNDMLAVEMEKKPVSGIRRRRPSSFASGLSKQQKRPAQPAIWRRAIARFHISQRIIGRRAERGR